MSALPVIEPFVEPAPSRPASRPRTLPRVPEPVIIELPIKRIQRGRVKQSQTQKRVSTIAGQLVGFTVITGIAFASFSLAGQVMVEKARRDGIRANARAAQQLDSGHSAVAWGGMPAKMGLKILAAGVLVHLTGFFLGMALDGLA